MRLQTLVPTLVVGRVLMLQPFFFFFLWGGWGVGVGASISDSSVRHNVCNSVDLSSRADCSTGSEATRILFVFAGSHCRLYKRIANLAAGI